MLAWQSSLVCLGTALTAVLLGVVYAQQIQKIDIDFSTAEEDPVTGELCVLQKVCLANPEALGRRLPRDPCFPPGCTCNSDGDCGDSSMPFCNDCNCSAFPQGCNCEGARDCPSSAPFCNDCTCSAFPFGCGCNSAADCSAVTPFCADCICSPFPAGCGCEVDSDCGGGTPFCADCNCSAFPQDCNCGRDGDCGGSTPFCNDCTCKSYPEGCNCSGPGDCSSGNPFCTDCICSRYPQGCGCNDDFDCGRSAPFCKDCNCSAFPLGCSCNQDSDCGGNAPYCNNCNCSGFPQGCDCATASDCGGSAPYCTDCQCSAFPPGCSCASDNDCSGMENRCLDCECKFCPVSSSISNTVINPPLTFVVDTTKSVKPDKYSIFNLTQKVVARIQEVEANIPSYLLVTFNDYGPDFRQNVDLRIQTPDVLQFKQEIIGITFESFDGGRDSKERLMQGLLGAIQASPDRSLIVVFTDNGSKDLKLKREIIRLKTQKQSTVYIVLTPIYEGFPRDPSLGVYAEVADEVFNISEVGADVFLTSVERFEETNCV